jgi:hypothetical protein
MLLKSIGVASVLGLAVLGGRASAHEFGHIDELALTLQRQTRALEGELAEHFRHAPHFRHLMSDAREMTGLAAHIHEVAHHGGSPYHLRSDLQNLDRLFRHLEAMVAHIEREAYHGGGAIRGHVRHVHELMGAVAGTLHHLEADIARITYPGPARGPAGVYGGASIGTPGFRMSIGVGR